MEQSPVARDTAEKFLKEVLKHYPIDTSAVLTKALLHCRARLFHRLGRMVLQGWPASTHIVRTALAKVEEKYALELIECGAISASSRPQAHYTPPAMYVTKGTKAAEKASAKGSHSKLAEEAPEIFGEYDGAAPPLPPPAVAPGSPSGAPGTPSGALATPLGAAGAPATPLGAAGAPTTPPSAVFAYELHAAAMNSLPRMPWQPLPGLVWKALARMVLGQLHIRHKLVAADIEVSVLEASSPHVFQARPLRDFAAGALVLVPFISEEPIPFAEGARLKRPQTLHPHLPFVVGCKAGAFELGDVNRFLLKSPLGSGAGLPEEAPAPFWAALATERAGDANMKVVTYRTTLPGASFSHDGEEPEAPAKRRKTKGGATAKAPALQVRVPALVNTQAVKRGTVLVVHGGFDLPADEDGDDLE